MDLTKNKTILYSLSSLLLVFSLLLMINLKKKKKNIESFSSVEYEEEEEEQISNLDNLLKKILQISQTELDAFLLDKQIESVNDIVSYLNELSTKQNNRISGYIELNKVYLLDDKTIIKLLNNNIYSPDKISQNSKFLSDIQKFALEYYILKKIPNIYYFELISEFGFKNIYDIMKDIYGVLILFDYYDILGLRYETLFMEEEEEEEEESSTQKPISELTLQIRDGIHGWIYQLSTRIMNLDSHPIFEKYSIKKRSQNKIKQMRLNYSALLDNASSNNLDFSKVGNEKANKQADMVKLYEESIVNYEYKIVRELNSNANKNSDTTIEDLSLDTMSKKFSKILTESMEEIINILNQQVEPRSDNMVKNLWDRYIFYFKNIMNVFLKEGRMFYIGFLFIFISVITLLS